MFNIFKIVMTVLALLFLIVAYFYLIDKSMFFKILGTIGIIIAIWIFLSISKFKPKTKTGEILTWKEFFKRWKQGIEGVTLFQQVKMQIQATWITIIGLLCGITVSIFAIKTLWWLLIILFGGLYNTSIQLIALIQKKNQIKQFENLQNIAFENTNKEVIKNV